MGLIDLLFLLWQGFQLIGQALIGFIQMVLGFFHIAIPEWAVQLAWIIALLFLIFQYGKHIHKLLIVVLLLVFGSVLVNAFV